MTQSSSPTKQIDPGRVIAVTIFAFFLFVNGLKLAQDEAALHSVTSTLVTVLTMAFYVLLIAAYLRRTPTDRTDRRASSWVAAFAGTAAAFLIPIVSPGLTVDPTRETVSALILSVGLVAMLWALGTLGTNISMVPQAREVVTHGPYAVVRHPLYAAEFVNLIGVCVIHEGPWPWAVAVLIVVFQTIRARREEAFLTQELPGYAAYKARTPMLVPALQRRQ